MALQVCMERSNGAPVWHDRKGREKEEKEWEVQESLRVRQQLIVCAYDIMYVEVGSAFSDAVPDFICQQKKKKNPVKA